MKTRKKIILLLAFISLFICLYQVTSTYAKYFTKTTSSIGSNIKKWNIKVNGESIKNGYKLTNPITAYFEPNENIADNQIAPTREGYFIINLDYNDVDLSFQYELTIEDNEIVNDISIFKLEVDGMEISTNNNTISNTVNINDPNDTTKSKEIKVYIKWNDDENNGAQMNNEQDTSIATNYDTIDFNIGIKLTQLT